MYYLGFLKQNTKDVVVFKSIKVPKSGDFSYFVRVVGPYTTEEKARKGLRDLKVAYGEHGYRENPSSASRARYRRKGIICGKDHVHGGQCSVKGLRKSNPGKYLSDKQALALTKKVVALGKRLFKHEQSEIRRGNPASGHMSKFLSHIKTLEKYAVGSKAYIDKLAEAYSHLQAAKKVMTK